MKRNFTFMLVAIGLAVFALVPRLEAARPRVRSAGAGPRLSEEAMSLANAYRIDPTPEKFAALKRQVSYDYDVFLKDLRAKIKSNKQDLRSQDAARSLEIWARDRDKNIEKITQRMIKEQKDRAGDTSATTAPPTKK